METGLLKSALGLLLDKDTNVVTGKNGITSIIKEKTLENGISFKRTGGLALLGIATTDMFSNGITLNNTILASLAILLPYIGKALLQIATKKSS